MKSENCRDAVENCNVLNAATKNAKKVVVELVESMIEVLDICAPVMGEPRSLADRMTTVVEDIKTNL